LDVNSLYYWVLITHVTPNAEHFSQQLLAASPIDVNGFVDALRCRHQSVWKVAEEQDPRALVRKVTAYQH